VQNFTKEKLHMLKKWWTGYALAAVIALGAGFYMNHTCSFNKYARGIASAPTETISDAALEQMDLGDDSAAEQTADEQALAAPDQARGLTCREIYQKVAESKHIRNVAVAGTLEKLT
jgi:hypothetical protein